MKILLIFAAYFDKKEFRGEKKRIFWEPLGIAYLKGYLVRAGYEVDLLYPLFEGMAKEDVDGYLKENAQNYNVIGISAPTFQLSVAEELMNGLKNNHYSGKVVLGGLGPSCKWEEFLDTGVDCIIIGEGEKTLLSIVSAVEKGEDIQDIKGIAYVDKAGNKIRNGFVELIENLDDNAFPARDIALKIAEQVDKNQFHVQIQSSRGCYGNCAFCSISRFLEAQGGTRWRSRSAKNIVEEIELLHRKHGFTKFDFMDENFFPPNKKEALEKAHEFADEINKRGLKCEFFIQFQLQIVSKELIDILSGVGIKCIFVGLDSLDDELLRVYNKAYNKEQAIQLLNIIQQSRYGFAPDDEYRVKIGYINFNPLSTIESLRYSGEMFKKYNVTYKKMFTKLRIDDAKSKVYKNIIERYPEYSEDNYFKHRSVDTAYGYIAKYYEYVIGDRNELRNLEMVLTTNKAEKELVYVKEIRNKIDEGMWGFYMKALDLVEHNVDEELLEVYLKKCMNSYDDYKTSWEKKVAQYQEEYVELDYLKLNNMHVKEYD